MFSTIHDPIPQYFEPRTHCPDCGDIGVEHGAIDTPPIALQLQDKREGVSRHWVAMRWRCKSYHCGGMWDAVSVNEVVGR